VALVDAPLALYRRYRPETFAEVIGQDHVTEPLRNALGNNRVNHAYLFSGPRGCGKTTSARILARAINCEKGPAPEPCGECQSCLDLARGGPGSIDVIEIDAASHGGVDDARDLRERAFFAPVQSRFKVYIIDEAHMVTTQGFNALLKLVEEPPPHLKFIFATTEPEKVIGTIKSRTHHYPFRLVPPKVLAEYMAQLCSAEGVAIEPAALPLVVRAGAGSVRDSLSVLDQLIGGAGPEGVTYQLAVALLGFTPDSLLDACVDGFAARDSRAVFEVVDKVIETGQDPKRFAEDLLRRLRDLVIVAAVPTAVTSGLIEVAEDQADRLQSQAGAMGPADLTRAADIVANGLLEMRGATAPRLQLELICAKVLLPGADDSTAGVQARLDRIERRMTLGTTTTTDDSAELRDATPRPARVSDDSAESSGRGASAGTPVGEGAGDTEPRQPPSRGRRGDATTAPAAAQPAQSAQPTKPAPSAGASAEPADAPPSPAETGQPTGQPAAQGQEVPAQIGLADVRRLWPNILQKVRERKKVTWVMLSQNAQVLDMDDKVLTIGLTHAGVRESFIRSGHDEILRAVLLKELLVDRRIDAVVDPSTGTGPGPATSPAPAAGGSPGNGGPADPVAQPGRPDPDPEAAAAQEAERRERAASKRRVAEASAAEHARQSEQSRQAEPAGRGTTDQPDDPEEDAFADDDAVLDEDSRSHTDLLRETLGAEVISEEPAN
jgi:DNA polymerase III subunit gamma/tau